MKHTMLLFAMIGLILTGCATVHMTEPLGAALAEPLDKAAWEGTWLVRAALEKERTPVEVRMVDATSGTLRMAFFEENKDRLQMTTATLAVRKAGEFFVISMKDKNMENEASPWLLVGKARIKKDFAVIWAPVPREIGKLVNAGKLPGTTQDESVKLERLTPAQHDAITSDTKLFAWDSPVILEKVN